VSELDVDIDGPVATLTLNRPDRHNALSAAMFDELTSALAELNPGDAVRVIRLRGAGKSFCAGADMTTRYQGFIESDAAEPAVGERRAWELGESQIAIDREELRTNAERLLGIWSYRKPVIAQVHGYCIAGGLQLIGMADLIYAARDAKFGHPPARAHGVLTTLGMMPARIGMLKTKELLFTGDLIDGAEAAEIGMVNRAVDPDVLDATVERVCQRIAKLPLDALSAMKHLTNRWFEIAGIRTAALEGAEFNSIYHQTPAFAEFVRIADEVGIAAAVRWRDEPFSEDPR
jgi:enoyl-CoA hydratase